MYSATLLVDLPLPGQDTNGCHYTTCPTVAGRKQQLQFGLPIIDYYPAVSNICTSNIKHLVKLFKRIGKSWNVVRTRFLISNIFFTCFFRGPMWWSGKFGMKTMKNVVLQ